LLPRYESGLLTSEEFFAEVCRITGYRGTVQDFAAAFGDIFVPIPPMIELQRRLRLKGLPAFIFSNTNDFAIRHIREAFPFFRDFDGYILSYEHQVMKPDARLYEVVERVSARRGEEILYFDDRPENAAAGSERGWRSVLHETPEQSRAVVQELGLL
jgi:FMN phosphatase YigB (HAD superfamily)